MFGHTKDNHCYDYNEPIEQNVIVAPEFLECIQTMENAQYDDNYNLAFEITPSGYYKHKLEQNGKTIFETLINGFTSKQLCTFTYKDQFRLFGWIHDNIDRDTELRFVNLLENFNRNRAILSQQQKQKNFENAAKEFENSMVDAKKAGTLQVVEKTGEFDVSLENCRMLENIFTAGPYTVYIVKINGVEVGRCTNGRFPNRFLRSMEYKGKHYSESEYPDKPYDFNCFWYSMLMVRAKHWRD